MSIAIVCLLILKAFLLPHNSGVHKIIMPAGTVFPSLFFFSYYYPYADAMLLGIIAALSLNPVASDSRYRLLVLIMITVMSSSNIVHLKDGPEDILKFTGWRKTRYRQNTNKNILILKRYINNPLLCPVYLSLPSGNEEIVKAQWADAPYNEHAKVVLLQYLRSIEEGKIILSLKNARPKEPFKSENELFQARTFLDVRLMEKCNLEELKQSAGKESFTPRAIEHESLKFEITPVADSKTIVFFLKGETEFTLSFNDGKMFKGKQDYGQTYQIFQFPVDGKEPGEEIHMTLELDSLHTSSFFIGPFFLTRNIISKIE